MNKCYFILLIFIAILSSCDEKIVQADIELTEKGGHSLIKGSSGFNVRIADKVWSYTHPDFIAAVDSLQPGWLRYFSGTMGDAFNSATGLYDYDYAWQFDHQSRYMKGYAFTQVKGPHTIADLYNVLGRVGGKLVVTINGFTETPQMAAELARFCKNNNIVVEAWQFCNEPYFYVPNRDRYWWNDGADYVRKMKPFGDSIRSVFPEAKLAPNFTWDGIWGFMREINTYQQEEGRYWDVFSKHSYAPHIGGSESPELAYRRGNTKLLSATSPKAMKQIEEYSWEGAPLLITEFGTWNRALSKVYSAIYNAEYTLRQLEHKNAFLIGSHEVSNKAVPAKNLRKLVTDAFANGQLLNTDSLRTGFKFSGEGKAIYLVHQATNNSDFTFNTALAGGPKVPGMKGAEEQGWYARGFRGVGNYDYLVICNRSENYIKPNISQEQLTLKSDLIGMEVFSADPEGNTSDISSFEVASADLVLKPYSVTLVKWEKDQKITPAQTRIYNTQITEEGVNLKWWKLENVDRYVLKLASGGNSEQIEVNSENLSYHLKSLEKGQTYNLSISGVNTVGTGAFSEPIEITFKAPDSPEFFNSARRYRTATLFWKSVEHANGYRVYQKDISGNIKVHDAKNVFGFRVEELAYDQPYEFWVTAYNGLGESQASQSLSITCKEDLPIPPRNISAKESQEGVQLNWINQDTINKGVKYRVYRGASPYNFTPIADGILDDSYVDRNPDEEEIFYSVKSYNRSGETNFFANTATLIEANELLKLEVASITEDEKAYSITVSFDNFPTDGDVLYGVAISNISYLNVEEQLYYTEDKGKESYTVIIPKTELRNQDKYAVKAMINTNGAPMYSEPPHKNISND